jgi:hypothetical protein
MIYDIIPANSTVISIDAESKEDASKKVAKKLYTTPDLIKEYFRIIPHTNPIDSQKDEFIGQIIDIFEDFLDDHKIIIPNPERDQNEDLEPEESANIFGTDYDELQTKISETLKNWNLTES